MKRRKNQLPEWTRMIWASEKALTTWSPRIARIGALMEELELRTVEYGRRRAAWIFVSPEQLAEKKIQLENRQLLLRPLQRTGILDTYASQGLPYQEGKPWLHRALVIQQGEEDDVGLLEQQFLAGDNEAIGIALGYPSCCRRFFDEIWVKEKWLDTTWPMAERAGIESDPPFHNPNIRTMRFEGTERWPANILGRWANIRAVPWLPCSLVCKATTENWQECWEPLAREIDEDALEWLEMLLRASWRWSALHGIAEIETSIFKISTRTDVCDELHAVEYVGEHELEAGAQGTRFPYRAPESPQLTKGESYTRGLAALANPKDGADLWEQNGFQTQEGMEAAHNILLQTLRQSYKPWSAGGYIMDPGCGNGLLLEKLGKEYPTLVGCGIECIRERALAAYERLPAVDEERIVLGTLGDIDNWRKRTYDLVLMMPGRLLELEPLVRNNVLYYLQQHVRQLLIYSYEDAGYINLEAYAEAAGLLDHWKLDFQMDVPGCVAAALFSERLLTCK